MGPKSEEIDGQTIAEHLMENILTEVSRSINERTDSCFDSFESLKLQTFGSEDILDFGCSMRETFGKLKECQENGSAKSKVNSLSCYPSLTNLPKVHSPSLSETSKQGEGDFQHSTIREAVAFYRLETGEENRPGGSKDYDNGCASLQFVENCNKDADKFDSVRVERSPETEEEGNCVDGSKECENSCASSMTTDNSHEQLIADLHRGINDVSFDDIVLSDTEDSHTSQRWSTEHTPFNFSPRETENNVCLYDDQGVLEHDLEGSYDSPDKQSCLHQSKKFCQFNSVNIFPQCYVPSDYVQQVNESYDKYDLITKEEDEVLSDGSSEELVIIERDEIDLITAENYHSDANSPLYFSSYRRVPTTGTSDKPEDQVESKKTFTVTADVEPINVGRNWEEDLEVQLSITEPSKLIELEDDDKEDCEFVKTRKYWTSIGLVTEKNVNPKYAAFLVDEANGIETVPGMMRVHEASRFARDLRDEDEIWKVDEVREDADEKSSWNSGKYGQVKCDNPPELSRENSENNCDELLKSGENLSDRVNINYLNFSPDATRKEKKKKKFVSRLTKSFTNLFRSAKKNPK